MNACSQASLEESGYKLVWSDEFQEEGLPDPSKWGYQVEANNWTHDRRHNELQWYMAGRAANSVVRDGKLVLTARREDWLTEPYTSARLLTKGRASWKYARVDVRAKLPAGRPGVWPAIWLMPTDQRYGAWPESGEIDVMENVGFEPGVVHATVHTAAYNHRIKTQIQATTRVPTAHDDFHVYSVEWNPDTIRCFVDGNAFFEFSRPGGGGATEWPFDQRFHLILNVAVGGNWGGTMGIDPSAFPTTFEIDYVRVYQTPATHTQVVVPPRDLPPPVAKKAAVANHPDDDRPRRAPVDARPSSSTPLLPPPPPPPQRPPGL
ncbi:hypothetical protein CTAYLR_001874 [Chrysophaeum taylorii]|uniref:GH16 domain-containing protein n=1 Tax=Chrysophaeum taylorii TaxID=2483200 RepID=A0AAD7U8X7_9STRA|nr:hypothetical protein CTAYLR_001874 [Chrysophaeum taylorii]